MSEECKQPTGCIRFPWKSHFRSALTRHSWLFTRMLQTFLAHAGGRSQHWFGRRDREEPQETTAGATLAAAMGDGMRAVIEVTATYAERLFL